MRELDHRALRRFCRPEDFGFESTRDIEPYEGMIGQERAERGLQLGLSIRKKGYNIYVSGAPGVGKTNFARVFAEKKAANEGVPDDLCYVYNFDNPKEPLLLRFKAGMGKEFKEDMSEFVSRLSGELPKVFTDKSFEDKRSELMKDLGLKRDMIIKSLSDEARSQNFGVKTTNTGIYFMPIIDGEIISEEEFDSLTQEQKDAISENSEAVQKQASEGMRLVKEYEKANRRRMEDLEYVTALFAVGYHIAPLVEKYSSNVEVSQYLQKVKEDILDNNDDFTEQDDDSEEQMQAILPWYNRRSAEESFAKYCVNLLVDNSKLTGAPVIVDFHPTYSNLVGEIEYDNEYGNLTTDFMKIKSGLLHRANGGYLILQAHDVLTGMHVWEILRQVLLTGEIVIEPIREYMTGVTVSCIHPEPVSLDVKLILIGDEMYYDILDNYDESFRKLMKIKVQFDYEMNYSRENIGMLARFVKKFVSEENMLEFDASAVAKLTEHLSRIAENQNKLSTMFGSLTELLTEADCWANMEKAVCVTAAHVQRAIAERDYRLSMYESKLNEMIDSNLIMLDVHGKKVGQINGLAVMDTGDHVFAKPSKITATTYMGKAGIINIEKEAEMSGNIHEKGIQVLTGYLGQIYAQDFPLSLSCRVCFEQNYSGVDGDSASSTELYAILSSLSGLPINQEIAVTGSLNQRGEIQAIGGVTYKIEGFFELCKKRGLTGKQGVIIPQQNIADLSLNDDVVEAVKEGMFHIYPIAHVDEGIEILMGAPAGKRSGKDKYPVDSVHGKVLKKLKEYHKKSADCE